MNFFAEHLLEIFFGLLSAGALGFCKYLWSRNKKLIEMQEADRNRQHRQMIVDEIEPIIDELTRLKTEINNVEQDLNNKFNAAQQDAEVAHKNMYDDLNKIQADNVKNFNLIINSYKFRLIQLCKIHLRDGYISEADFEQITEMYKLYHGLGGNGQAQEYYEKVLHLEIKED